MKWSFHKHINDYIDAERNASFKLIISQIIINDIIIIIIIIKRNDDCISNTATIT